VAIIFGLYFGLYVLFLFFITYKWIYKRDAQTLILKMDK
jgi:hypothetical protein